MECVCFTLIVDDIVLPHGETVMEVLGGGGPQTLFGYQLVANQSAAVGLSAGVGPDLPRHCQDWLESLGVDTSGLVPYQRPTPRAWQVFEEWGRRTQIWRGRDDPCDELYDMLRPRYDMLPPHFQRSSNFHLGVHPLRPPRSLMRQLRDAAHQNGGVLSIEPYTAAEEAATPEQVTSLLAHCDIFSPNEAEAASIVGPGSPEEVAVRLLALSPRGGADLVVVRCGPAGALLARRSPPTPTPASEPRAQAPPRSPGHGPQPPQAEHPTQPDVEAYRVPAVADTAVVDVTGCGNAFCGGFLAALFRGAGAGTDTRRLGDEGGAGAVPSALSTAVQSWPGPHGSQLHGQPPSWVRSGDLRMAGCWGCVAASFMAEERGVPLINVTELQERAGVRLRALLPRVRSVQLAQTAARREAACEVAAAMRSGGACALGHRQRLLTRSKHVADALQLQQTLASMGSRYRMVRV